MTFYAGGRGAQTSHLVHVSSPAYEWHICSATYRRSVSTKVDISMNINTAPSLLPNCRKLFLWVFYFFSNERPNMGTYAKTALWKPTKSSRAHIRKGI